MTYLFHLFFFSLVHDEKMFEQGQRKIELYEKLILNLNRVVVCKPFRRWLPLKHLQTFENQIDERHCHSVVSIVVKFDQFHLFVDFHEDVANAELYYVLKAIEMLLRLLMKEILPLTMIQSLVAFVPIVQ